MGRTRVETRSGLLRSDGTVGVVESVGTESKGHPNHSLLVFRGLPVEEALVYATRVGRLVPTVGLESSHSGGDHEPVGLE